MEPGKWIGEPGDNGLDILLQPDLLEVPEKGWHFKTLTVVTNIFIF